MTSQSASQLQPLDALAEDILYVADAELRLVFVNDGWRRFAASNNGSPRVESGRNINLLDCLSGSERLRWGAIYGALLSGQLRTHEENFICPSPVRPRTYRLRIHPHLDAEGRVVHLTHHAERVDETGEPTILGERLRALNDDLDLTVQSYKHLVLDRPVEAARLVTASYVAPLQQVGGDVLWHRDWPGGGTDFVIADAMGHGPDAARLAVKMVLLLETHADGKLPVAENVARLNQAMAKLASGSRAAKWGPLFATGLYLRVDPALQSLTICSFGHSGPIFSEAGYIEPKPGLPVGIIANGTAGPWAELVVPFENHGRRFIIFTDGLTEQFDLAGEMYGEARLEQAFRRNLHLPLQQLVADIRAEVDAFRGGALIKDDQALLAIEVIEDR